MSKQNLNLQDAISAMKNGLVVAHKMLGKAASISMDNHGGVVTWEGATMTEEYFLKNHKAICWQTGWRTIATA